MGVLEARSKLVGDVNGQGAWAYHLANDMLLEHHLIPFSFLDDSDWRQDLPGCLEWDDDDSCAFTVAAAVVNSIQQAKPYRQSWQRMYLTQPPPQKFEQFLGELAPAMTATHGKVYETRSGRRGRPETRSVELQDQHYEMMAVDDWMKWVEDAVGRRRHYKVDWSDVVVRWDGMPFWGDQWDWWSERLGDGYKMPFIEEGSETDDSYLDSDSEDGSDGEEA